MGYTNFVNGLRDVITSYNPNFDANRAYAMTLGGINVLTTTQQKLTSKKRIQLSQAIQVLSALKINKRMLKMKKKTILTCILILISVFVFAQKTIIEHPTLAIYKLLSSENINMKDSLAIYALNFELSISKKIRAL